MNERIKELIVQAGVQDRGYFIYQYGGQNGNQSVEKAIDLEKFAELIVRECVNTLEFHGFDEAVPYIKWMATNKLGVEE